MALIAFEVEYKTDNAIPRNGVTPLPDGMTAEEFLLMWACRVASALDNASDYRGESHDIVIVDGATGETIVCDGYSWHGSSEDEEWRKEVAHELLSAYSHLGFKYEYYNIVEGV